MYLHSKHLSKNRWSSIRAFIYTYFSHGHCKWHVPNTVATLWSTQLLQKICCQHRSNYQPKSPCSLQLLPPTAETTRKLFLLLPCFKCRTLPDKTMGIFISLLGTTVVEIGKPFILTLIYKEFLQPPPLGFSDNFESYCCQGIKYKGLNIITISKGCTPCY